MCTWSSANAQDEPLIFPLGHDDVSWSVSEMQNLKPVTLVQQEEDDEDEDDDEDDDNDGSESEFSSPRAGFKLCTFDIPRLRYIDDEEDNEDDDDVLSTKDGSSSLCSGCSTEDDYPSDSSCSAVSDRYVVVSGTPHKILEHLLSDLRLDEHQGATEGKEAGEWTTLCSVSGPITVCEFIVKEESVCVLVWLTCYTGTLIKCLKFNTFSNQVLKLKHGV